MRHSVARFVVALALALAATGPARASGVAWTTWEVHPWDTSLGKFVGSNGDKLVYVGPYTLDAISPLGVQKSPFAAPCTSDTVPVTPGQGYSWLSVGLTLDDARLDPTNTDPTTNTVLAGWRDSSTGRGTTGTNLKKTAWLFDQFYQLDPVVSTGKLDAYAVGAIHEAIWKLDDIGYDNTAYGGSYVNDGVAEHTSQYWYNLVNTAYADTTNPFFYAQTPTAKAGWQAYNVLMPVYDSAGKFVESPWVTPAPPNAQPFVVKGNFTPQSTTTPEPGSMALLLLGVGLFGLQRRRSRSVAA